MEARTRNPKQVPVRGEKTSRDKRRRDFRKQKNDNCAFGNCSRERQTPNQLQYFFRAAVEGMISARAVCCSVTGRAHARWSKPRPSVLRSEGSGLRSNAMEAGGPADKKQHEQIRKGTSLCHRAEPDEKNNWRRTRSVRLGATREFTVSARQARGPPSPPPCLLARPKRARARPSEFSGYIHGSRIAVHFSEKTMRPMFSLDTM